MARQGQVEFLQQPLRVIMGRSYLKYKKVAEDMLFLNKAVRSMSKRELMALVGYFALKYGIVDQPMPPHSTIGEKNDKSRKTNIKESGRNRHPERTTDRTVVTNAETRMDSSRLG